MPEASDREDDDPRDAGPDATARTDGFTDAVLAIIVTLMAVEIGPPPAAEVEARGLIGAVLHHWPAFSAFGLSFLVVGQIWLLHHALWRVIGRVDRPLLMLHLGHLLLVSLVPLAARLLGDHLAAGGRLLTEAVTIYAVLGAAIALSMIAFWRTAAARGVLRGNAAADRVAAMVRRQFFSFGGYGLAAAAAWLSPWLGLLVIACLQVFHASPGATWERG